MLVELQEQYPSIDEIWKQYGLEISGGPTAWGQSFWKRALLCAYDGVNLRKEGFFGSYSKALILGGMAHGCLYQWYRYRQGLENALLPCDVIEKWANEHSDGSAYFLMLLDCVIACQQMITSYAARYSKARGNLSLGEDLQSYDFSPDDVFCIEEAFEVVEPFPYSARLDLGVSIRDSYGKKTVATVDHKTHSRFDENFAKSFFQDGQIYGHFHLWNSIMVPKGYPEMTHAIINVIEKPEKAGGKYEFRRVVYPISPERFAIWLHQMTLRAQSFIRQWEAVETDPSAPIWKNAIPNYASCFERRFARACPRIDHCLAVIDETKVVTRKSPEEELEEVLVLFKDLQISEGQKKAIEWLRSSSYPEFVAQATTWGVEPDKILVAKEWLAKATTPVVQVETKKLEEKFFVPEESASLIIADLHETVPAKDTQIGQPYYVRAVVAWRDERPSESAEEIPFLLPGKVKFSVLSSAICIRVTLRDELLPPPEKEAEPEPSVEPSRTKLLSFPMSEKLVDFFYLGHFKSGGEKHLSKTESDVPYYEAFTVGEKKILRLYKIIGGVAEAIPQKGNKDLFNILRTKLAEKEGVSCKE